METHERLAHGFHRAGVEIITHVPGFGAGAVFQKLCHIRNQPIPISLHEEVAYTMAHGAALAGKRSAVLIKAHGLAKAANSVVDSLIAGVNAGLVVGVFHDRDGRHSDSILDSRQLIAGLDLPFLTVDQDAPEKTVQQAFTFSEALRLPVALLSGDEPFIGQPLSTVPFPARTMPYRRDIAQHVLCPPFARYQRDLYEAKRGKKNWQAVPRPAIPRCPEDIPFPWRGICDQYSPLFQAFKPCRGEVVTGETGLSSLFAFPPFDAIDVVTCLGGSIPLGLGFLLAGYHNVWAVSGDFSFLAAGHLGLAEARSRQLPLKVLVLYNGCSATTGGEKIPEGLMERTLKGYLEFVVRLSRPKNPKHCQEIFQQTCHSDTMKIVLADYRNTWNHS